MKNILNQKGKKQKYGLKHIEEVYIVRIVIMKDIMLLIIFCIKEIIIILNNVLAS